MTISKMLEKYTSLYQHSPDIRLVTADGVSMNMSRLVLTTFSPFLRSLLISTPCCTSPSLVLPFCSSTAVTSLMGLLKHGVSRQFSGDLRGLKEEVIETAEVLGVDVTGLEYWGEIKENNNDDMVKIEIPETLEETETLYNIYINEGICDYKGTSESETIEQTISESLEDEPSEQSGVKQIKYECDSNDKSSEEKVPESDPDVDLIVSEEREYENFVAKLKLVEKSADTILELRNLQTDNVRDNNNIVKVPLDIKAKQILGNTNKRKRSKITQNVSKKAKGDIHCDPLALVITDVRTLHEHKTEIYEKSIETNACEERIETQEFGNRIETEDHKIEAGTGNILDQAELGEIVKSIVSIAITPINQEKLLTHVNNEKKTCLTPFNMKEKKGLMPLKPKPSSGSKRKVHPCGVCGKSFAYQSQLGKHYYSHFSTKLKERYASLCEGFVCIICGKNHKKSCLPYQCEAWPDQ